MTDEWTKPKDWPGKDLKGTWEVTLKIDGVQARLSPAPAPVVSRAGKPLFNMDHLRPASGERIVEAYTGSWASTAGDVRRHKGTALKDNELYDLWPVLDRRLVLANVENPTAEQIKTRMAWAVSAGWEGLVLKQGNVRYKVKPVESHDVQVLDIQAGAGKHEGRMGALMTSMGKVGTGFTDAERIVWWNRRKRIATQKYIIEVSCMGLTPAGKFRHPRYERYRFDKAEEGTQ